jgi:hypothetical protein
MVPQDAPTAPKSAPGACKDPPRESQERPKSLQERLKSDQRIFWGVSGAIFRSKNVVFRLFYNDFVNITIFQQMAHPTALEIELERNWSDVEGPRAARTRERAHKEPPSRSQERSRLPQDRPKSCQERPKSPQLRPRSSSRVTQEGWDAPWTAPGCPRTRQQPLLGTLARPHGAPGCANSAQKLSRSAPGACKDTLRGSQEPPRAPQEQPKSIQERLKSAVRALQERPKSAQRGSQTTSRVGKGDLAHSGVDFDHIYVYFRYNVGEHVEDDCWNSEDDA